MTFPPNQLTSVRSRGFALIVTLTLMILLSVIALGLLTLSSVSLRSAGQQQLMQEARQNARLALMLAIGELQTATGPDQRITAAAEIKGDSLKQPHLTGAWQGWKWDGAGTTPKFSDRKQSQFLRWLVSTREPATSMAIDFPSAASSGEMATLVKGKRAAGENDEVDAQIIPISGFAKNRKQGLAWAVFDESTKLPTVLPEPVKKTATGSVALMNAAPLPGYASATKRNWSGLTTAASNRMKLISPGQASLAGIANDDRGFHDLTSSTSGVLADAGKGGLAVDLSRLFSGSALPAAYANRFLYSDTDTPLVGSPVRFSGANPFPSPDPSWRLLRSHYRLYDKLSGGLTPSLETTAETRPPAGTTGLAAQNSTFFHSQQIAPVIAKAQFVFSIGFGWHPGLTGATSATNDTLPANQRDYYVTWLVVDPVITLWNPYNVSVRFTGSRIDLYRVPLTFRLYKNGKLINPEYTHLANTFLSTDFNGRAGTYYRLNLLPDEGKTDFVMAPGEHVVFTATNHVKHFNLEFSQVGLNLRRGFSPPAGNSSKPTVGGTSTLNVCVGPTGQPTGTDYGKPVRTIAVKPNDRIQVEVKPGRANIDKPAETGGKEISGYLKYYVGPPSSQRLIGGIELDYDTDDSKYLPSYSKEDLPTIVVSDTIPKSPAQADVYLGPTPPVVRFKEPFLVSTFQLKTERNSKFPSRSWLNNSPVNLFASEGIDQKEPWSAQQYELQWESMTDWPPTSPGIEISNTLNHGYGGPGIYAQSGLEYATHSAIPLAPALSIPQLRHAPLNVGGQLPLTSQIVANAFAPALINPDSVRATSGNRTFLDHSYFANSALFDRSFFSGLADPGGVLDKAPDVRTAITDFVDGRAPLANPRFVPHTNGRKSSQIADEITASDGYLKSAAYLLIDSPFNVNSTRVDVWEAFLASTLGTDVPMMKSGTFSTDSGDGIAVSRLLPSNGKALESGTDPVSNDLAKWNGHRRLTKAQIRRLAEEIVTEVRARGPFQSMAEFVNRRPEAGTLGQSGALQAALQRADINQIALNPRSAVTDSSGTGNTADGAPGILTQADLLTPIAPVLTVRGDTFRIRSYGESASGTEPKVRAWCEAVIQRLPEYIDAAADQPWTTPKSPANIRFGRHYELISFRWLLPSEV